MAENKKGFILYADQRSIIDMLDNETAGMLFKHIFSYVNDELPESNNPLLNLAFEPIKLQLKRDLKHWELIKEKRSIAGKASANKRQHMSTHVESVEQNSTNPTVIVKDNVNVIVKDNVNVILKGGDLFKILLSQENWLDMTCKAFALPWSREKNHQYIIDKLRMFIAQLEATNDLDKPEKEIKKHFINWLRIQADKDQELIKFKNAKKI